MPLPYTYEGEYEMQNISSFIADRLVAYIIIGLANHDAVVDNRHGYSQHSLEQDAVEAEHLREERVENVLLSVILYLRVINSCEIIGIYVKWQICSLILGVC